MTSAARRFTLRDRLFEGDGIGGIRQIGAVGGVVFLAALRDIYDGLVLIIRKVVGGFARLSVHDSAAFAHRLRGAGGKQQHAGKQRDKRG